jgi:hypothetical protein
MKYRTTIVALTLMGALMGLFSTPAAAGRGYMGGGGPYGGYCQGMRWGWYGARQPVATIKDARKYIEKYYEGQDVVIGTITDQGTFFKADIKDREGKLVDQVIINKRSGRIRSIY